MTDMLDTLQSPLYQRGSLFGANLVASEFADSQIVIWGPRGCSPQLLDAQYNQRQECHFRHYEVSQSEILTDGISALKRNLMPHIRDYGVKGPLFLFLGDAPQLTTENIEDFVQNSVHPDFPIIFVETGFRGNYYQGINDTLYQALKRLCKEKLPAKSNLINLIPEVGTSQQWRANAEEVRRILQSLGFEVNIVANKYDVRDYPKLAEAGCTLLLNPAIGKKAGQLLQERFDIPLLVPANMPIGLQGTDFWIRELGALLDIPASLVEEVIEKERSAYFTGMVPGLMEENYNQKVNIIRTSRFVIADEYQRGLQWSRMLTEELNFEAGHLFPTDGLDQDAARLPAGVELVDGTSTLVSLCQDEKVKVVFGSDWMDELLARKLDNLVCLSNPVVKVITLVPKPYYGYRGALHLLEDVLNSVHY